jgi:competence protein ComEA
MVQGERLPHHCRILALELMTMAILRALLCTLFMHSLAQAAPAPPLVQPIEINDAREMDLDGLPGLGPKTTRIILQARASQSFDDWQDLMARVPGIKSKTAQKLSNAGLRVRGQPFGDFKASAAHTKVRP